MLTGLLMGGFAWGGGETSDMRGMGEGRLNEGAREVRRGGE